MDIVVTGDRGFIGSYVTTALLKAGHTVRGVDAMLRPPHSQRAREKAAKAGGLYRVGRFAREWLAHGGFAGKIDAVVHLAAAVSVSQAQYQPYTYTDHNVGDTMMLWEAIIKRRVPKVVVASSMSIYGEGAYQDLATRTVLDSGVVRVVEGAGRNRDWNGLAWRGAPMTHVTPILTTEHKAAEPASIYALNKHDQERYSLLLGAAHKVDVVALRFFNVLGAGQALSNPYTGVAASFCCRLLRKAAPVVLEDGCQTRDFVDVRDVARAVRLAVEADGLTGVFNVATGQPTMVGELAERLSQLLKGPAPDVRYQLRSGDIRHCVGDASKLAAAVGWAPRYGLGETLDALVGWVRTQRLPSDGTERALSALATAGLLR